MDVFKLLKEKYNEYKIKKKKDKLFIKRQKEIIKKQQKLNDEVEKEYKEEIKKEQEEKYKNISKKDRLIKDAKEFIEDLMDNKEFEELESVLSEEEKKREEELRKENKKITIKVVILFVTIITIITILSLMLGEIIKTDLEKVTQPMLEEYYKNTFTEKAKIKTIRYLDKEKHIVLATFTSDINLMCVDNEHIGNDVTYESIYQDYKNYLISNMQATNFIVDNPKLSYIPYLVEYNYYIDYIDTLPSDLSFKQMLNTKNLDIVDVILYEGDINKNNLMNMLGSFGDNSKLYLVKQSSQNILNLSIITKEYIKSFDVIEEKYSNDGDTFFRFNQEINKIDYVDITNYGPGYDNDNIH